LEKISVPKSVQEHLSEGEEVVGKLVSPSAEYYATNRRLLRFTSESQFQSLEYSSLSVNSVSSRWWLSLPLRAFAVVFGLANAFMGVLIRLDSTTRVEGFPGGKTGLMLFFLVLGLGIAALGASSQSKCYQIQAPGIAKDDKSWRIGPFFRWYHGGDNFVRTLREKSVRN